MLDFHFDDLSELVDDSSINIVSVLLLLLLLLGNSV